MAKLVAHMRLIAGALALAFIVAISAPVSAQQPSMVNPTADAVKEQQLLQQLIRGRRGLRRFLYSCSRSSADGLQLLQDLCS